MKKLLFLVFSLSVLFLSCKNDDDGMTTTKNFTITIENIMEGKDNFSSGTTGLILPGASESYTFNAGKGHYLNFATMFVQSNDLFYGFDDTGVALYDTDANALTGDVTAMVELWDAGTEVNEEPGVGANQAPRQSGPDEGIDENGTVEEIGNINDGFSYPDNAAIIRVTLSHDGGTEFTLTIDNISDNSALPSPLAPGVWTIHSSDQTPLFAESGSASIGLERLAEDGNNEMIDAEISANSGLVTPFAPGAYSIETDIFRTGETSSSELEALAEDGDPSGFSNAFNTPDGASAPAPIFPGDSYSFTFSAEDGDVLSLATMLIQSNDWFVGANGINLYSNAVPVSGDITNLFKIYDSGTEKDEYAGAGNNQAPRQSAANSGEDENGMVEEETSPGAHVPAVSEMLKITLSSN